MTSSAGPGGGRLDVGTAVKGSELWIFISGDADISTLGHIDAALGSIVLDGLKAACIDLSGLGFVDVAALRRLTTFAMHLRQSGLDVKTVGAPPLLRRVARLVPAQELLGLV